MRSKVSLTALLLLLITPVIYTQAIHIRTVPVIAANQFDIQPSLARGMGNLSVAFDDPLADPFVNPAKASRLKGLNLFSSPSRSTWSNEDGRTVYTPTGSAKYPGASINSIPFGGFYQSGDIFGGGLVTHQGYSAQRSVSESDIWLWANPTGVRPAITRNDIGNNTYVVGLFGVRFPESNVSVGGSVSWGYYGAIDGVNLLYPGSYDIKQQGKTIEYKVGLIGELTERDQIEFVVARNTFQALHEITFLNPPIWPLPAAYRAEINRDESEGWVMQGGYKRTVGDEWKLGAVLTVNWKEHPKIPNYSLANIPRDPGTSVAYNIGFGALQYGKKSTWGFEYIYEPITSYTWAEAGEGGIWNLPLPPNFKTVENFFEFYNHIIRVGVNSISGNFGRLGGRLGVQLHFYKYDLTQNNNIWQTSRSLSHGWLETTLSGGLNIKFSHIQLMYTLQVILGNGMVGVESPVAIRLEDALRNDFIIAPSGDLVVEDIPLVTQQITFVYNLE